MNRKNTPSHKKLGSVPTAANRFLANATSAYTPKEKAGPSARLSRGERHLAIELARHGQTERRDFSQDTNDQDWIETELMIELDRMRKRDSPPSD
jgi:hypothetical protein